MDPAIRLLRELVAVNSVNPTLVPGAPGEQQIADLVAAHLRRSGLDVSVEAVAPGRPNVVGVLEGRAKGRTLMFCGHTDTVGVAGMTDPFTPLERDGRLYGRGAQDMKGGVAAMMAAAAAVAAAGGLASGRLIVAAVVDEEHSSIGADALVKTWRADAAVVTEPTDLAIAVGHKGFAWVEIVVDGRALAARVRVTRCVDSSMRTESPGTSRRRIHSLALAAGDVMLAQIAVRSTATITQGSWISVVRTTNGTVAQEIFRPNSRKYDREEHSYPKELDMLAAVIDGMNDGGALSGAGAAGVRQGDNGDGDNGDGGD